MRIKISADSTCDLSPELIETYNIGITPLYIEKGGQNCRDGMDITPPGDFRLRALRQGRVPHCCRERGRLHGIFQKMQGKLRRGDPF